MTDYNANLVELKEEEIFEIEGGRAVCRSPLGYDASACGETIRESCVLGKPLGPARLW